MDAKAIEPGLLSAVAQIITLLCVYMPYKTLCVDIQAEKKKECVCVCIICGAAQQ